MKRKEIFVLVAVFFILISLLLPTTATALSFPLNFGGAFGGKILSVIPCTCAFSLLLRVGPPKGGSFLYVPGVSKLHQNFSLIPGRWILGTSFGRASCLTGFPPFCAPFGSGAIIRKIGTN